MGASESTARSNATKEEEERESHPANSSSSDGTSIGAAAAIATAAAGAAVAAWGISKMLSNNPETQETQNSLVNPSHLIESIGSIVASGRSSWSPPPPGRFKLNTDGACRPKYVGNADVQRGPSGYGGILRDHRGKWVQGFIGFIGESDCLTSEFHGILKGLEVLDKLNLKMAILETDSQAAYEWVTRRGDGYGKSEIVRASWPMIMKCRQLADKNGIAINLVHGENANKCADKLANMGIARGEEYVEIKFLPDGLRFLVEKDAELCG
ncbi:hypothetical protein SSX86_016055 [Deinandra increscens subsp. villosa]|uniref:RNase H type-1 domain-containing protein n=1 Tax=Deinandra increscens subsp. villosa TaxID=3103831 RepID=A0AAP0D4R0_9ASTR